jgi:hypothetical protein
VKNEELKGIRKKKKRKREQDEQKERAKPNEMKPTSQYLKNISARRITRMDLLVV